MGQGHAIFESSALILIIDKKKSALIEVWSAHMITMMYMPVQRHFTSHFLNLNTS